MAEYTYGSPSYTTSSPSRPYTPPHSVYSAALMSLSAGEMSSDGTSGRTSRGSGSHSLTSPRFLVPCVTTPSVCPPWLRSGRERKRRPSKHDDFSDDDDDFAPANVPAELGAILACASTDSKISVLSFKGTVGSPFLSSPPKKNLTAHI